jgi:hypothetical protein
MKFVSIDGDSCAKRSVHVSLRKAKTGQALERLEKSEREASKLEVELYRAEGVIEGFSHYAPVRPAIVIWNPMWCW